MKKRFKAAPADCFEKPTGLHRSQRMHLLRFDTRRFHQGGNIARNQTVFKGGI